MRRLLFLAPLLALAVPVTTPAESGDDVPVPAVPFSPSVTAPCFPVAKDRVGPPHVFDPAARLDLGLADSDPARGASLAPVRGPRMTVVLDNDRAVPVTVSIGIYASN